MELNTLKHFKRTLGAKIKRIISHNHDNKAFKFNVMYLILLRAFRTFQLKLFKIVKITFHCFSASLFEMFAFFFRSFLHLDHCDVRFLNFKDLVFSFMIKS